MNGWFALYWPSGGHFLLNLERLSLLPLRSGASPALLTLVISRRRFLTGFGVALSPLGSTANAQEHKGGKAPRVGYVTSGTRSVNVEAFEQGLRELGYVIGQSVMVEYRFAEGRVGQAAVKKKVGRIEA